MTRDTDENGEATRRTFLQATAGTVALGGVAGLVGAQQDGPQLIVLDGRTSAWQGVAPQSIAGQSNPTLPLVVGQDYRVRWTNVDGQPHNFVILGPNGEGLVATDIISTNGATQEVRFTARENMVEYYCEVHPTSMRGNVQLVDQQQLEPVNESQLRNQTEIEAPPEEDQNITGGVNVSEPVGLSGQDWPNNTSQLDQFRQRRNRLFDQTGNGTVRGNLSYGANLDNQTRGNQTEGNETQGNGTQDDQANAVSANDVRQVARAPGLGIVTTLGGVFGGLAAMARRSDD